MPSAGYEILGFTVNPFNSNTAEREPEIAAYAVHPPYLDRTKAASVASGAFFLEGARGSGKSATRLTVAKELFRGQGGPLIVGLTNFNVFRPYIRGGISIDLYVTQIAFLVVETVLSWISSLPDAKQEEIVRLIKPQESFVSKFVSSFYLNRADHSRSGTAKETFELLETSTVTMVALWGDKRWNQIAGVVARLAGTFGKKYADIDIGDPAAFQKLIERQRGDGFHDPMYTLVRTVEFARTFGFESVLVQIDKVDETDWTGSDIGAASDLIVPLLANIGLHEVNGLTWSFFVWDEVSQWMRLNHGSMIRFDKIPSGEIDWEVEYLEDLVSRRMSFFSNSKIKSLTDIFEAAADTSTLLPKLVKLTSRSPRQLISALDHIFSSHIQRTQGAPKKLDLEAFEQGMDSYALKSLREAGLLEDARIIAKMQLPNFVVKDVQGLIRQSAQSARGKIDGWLSTRLIRQFGTRPTGGAGRPVDEFEISDPRASRVLSRKL